jgi:hypothetical protein
MQEGCKFRRKNPEKISLDELMGAAGMSGFGAVLELPPGSRPQLPHLRAPHTRDPATPRTSVRRILKIKYLGEERTNPSRIYRISWL